MIVREDEPSVKGQQRDGVGMLIVRILRERLGIGIVRWYRVRDEL